MPPPSNQQRALREAGPYLALGLQFALTMVFCVGGGFLLDRWLGTSPWFTLAGAFFGILSIFALLFRLTAELNRKPKRPPPSRAEPDPDNP